MINLKVFRRMISILKDVPDHNFDLRFFSPKQHSCGSACCVIGHYATKYDDIILCQIEYGFFAVDRQTQSHEGLLSYLGITVYEYYYLFFESSYDRSNRTIVLKRLQKFILDKIMEYHQQLPKKTITQEKEYEYV